MNRGGKMDELAKFLLIIIVFFICGYGIKLLIDKISGA